MLEFIQTWWPVLPTVVALATAIARITPNETDNKVVYFLTRIIDSFAIHSTKTIKK